MNFGGKRFIPTAPDKGSFPLDHEGECKSFMKAYLACLNDHDYDQSKCRDEAKAYLQCRMDKQLMDKEEFNKLGFKEEK